MRTKTWILVLASAVAFSIVAGVVAAPDAHAGKVIKGIGKAIGGAVKAVGKAVGGAAKAIGKGVGTVAKGVGKAVGGMGKAIGKAAGAMGKAVGKAARTIGKGILSGVKAIGGGLVKIGKGVVKVAAGIGKVAVGAVKGAVKFAGGVLKGAGKLIRGDLKGAFNEVKAGAAAGLGEVGKGLKAGVKDAVSGLGDIAKGAGQVAVGALQVALPFLDVEKILAKIKELIVGLLEKIGKGVLKSGLGGIFGKVVGMIAPDVKTAIDAVTGLIHAGKQITDAIDKPDGYLHVAREMVIDKLGDLAMRVFTPPLQTLVGALAGFGLKLLKHLVTTPLTVAITSAVASFTFGIGAALAPLIKLGLDKFLDWAVDQVKNLLAKAVMGIQIVKDFLKKQIIAPVVNNLHDKIVGFIQQKFPNVGKHVTTTGQQAEGAKATPAPTGEGSR